MKSPGTAPERIFAACRRILGPETWEDCLRQSDGHDPASFAGFLAGGVCGGPSWLGDLARLELVLWQARSWHEGASESPGASGPPPGPSGLELNPALQLVSLEHAGLCAIIRGDASEARPDPEMVLVWPETSSGEVRCAPADNDALLALKIVAEELSPGDVAREAGVPTSAVLGLLRSAKEKGQLRKPPPLLRRGAEHLPADPGARFPEDVLVADGFTLQWHLTQACDLHCRHCYDRSARKSVPLGRGLALLDEMAEFCRQRRVEGQVSFTGGNPLLHPNFMDFYKKGAELDLGLALLGNPCDEATIDAMLEVEKPVFYQVSLEGLEEHNDYIRGKGHFARVLDFLGLLRDRGVLSMVMLTLTRANMEQVLPLARLLEGRVERFTFNRLSLMGEGAALASADKDAYVSFLQDYIEASRAMPHVRLKDNLVNAALDTGATGDGPPLFSGCTGHGCGAAFNFLSVLGDGEAHACRKLHSPLGNVYEQGLAAVYDGEPAASYRRGSSACSGCRIRPVCGGCLAVTAGLGFDPLTQRDPYCFYEQAP